MKLPFNWVAAGVLALAPPASRAGDEVLVPGDPPLTRTLAERRIDYWEWVFAVRLDGRQRAELRKLQIDEWSGGEKEWKERWVNFLAAWHQATRGADGARMRSASRYAAIDALARGEGDAVGRSLFARQIAPAAPAVGAARRDAEDALRMAALQLQFDHRQQFLRDLSAAQARHHETMMFIIRNMRPAGRYEYNPSTGRYDRYVPNP